jgi:hypothetical protein
MGARCWDCGVKVGRCYEHGTSDCMCVSCGCDEPTRIATGFRAVEDEEVDW